MSETTGNTSKTTLQKFPEQSGGKTNKHAKKPVKIPKSAKIMMGIIIVLMISFICCALIYIPRIQEEKRHRKEYEELINVEPDLDKIVAQVNNSSIDVYKELIYGKYIARTTDADTKGRIFFVFERNGNFYGHSSRNEDDYGTWDLESDKNGFALVTTVPDVMERYELSFNNNDNLVLKAVDGTVMVLEPTEEIFEQPQEETEEKK